MTWILDDIFTHIGVIMNPAKREGYESMAYLWLGAALAGGICMYLVYVLMKPEEF
jgi:3-deoxy-D-arabino-heptulosonate 7-phosphate (DAHP) synthase